MKVRVMLVGERLALATFKDVLPEDCLPLECRNVEVFWADPAALGGVAQGEPATAQLGAGAMVNCGRG